MGNSGSNLWVFGVQEGHASALDQRCNKWLDRTSPSNARYLVDPLPSRCKDSLESAQAQRHGRAL